MPKLFTQRVQFHEQQPNWANSLILLQRESLLFSPSPSKSVELLSLTILPAFSRHLSDFNCSTVNNSPSQQLSFNRSSACLTFPWAVASRKAYRVLPGSSQVSSEQKGIEAFSVAPTGFHCHSWSNRLNSPVVNKDSKAKVIRNGCFTTLLPLIPGKLLRLWSSAPLK